MLLGATLCDRPWGSRLRITRLTARILSAAARSAWHRPSTPCPAARQRMTTLRVRPASLSSPRGGLRWSQAVTRTAPPTSCKSTSPLDSMPSGQATSQASVSTTPCIINTPFATRCPKKAKSWRNTHKTGAAGATAQLGLPGLLRGRKLVHNTRIKALVCTFSPANTLATPVSLRHTADAIMQDLHQTGCSRPGWSWGAADVLPIASL